MSRRHHKPASPRAEDFLNNVDAISIRLDNGEVVELVIADEVEIPTDIDELVSAGRKSAAKLAFWSYQAERALEDVRRCEQKLATTEGRHYDLYRLFFTDEAGVDPTEGMIRAKIDQDTQVRQSRLALRRRRREYGLLRAVRDAVDRRDSMLRALLHRYEP